LVPIKCSQAYKSNFSTIQPAGIQDVIRRELETGGVGGAQHAWPKHDNSWRGMVFAIPFTDFKKHNADTVWNQFNIFSSEMEMAAQGAPAIAAETAAEAAVVDHIGT
jgi:hypothetical protein